MEKLQQPFNILVKHLKNHHKLTFNNDVILYEQEKDIFVFGRFFFKENKSIYGKIDLQRKEILYKIGDLKRDCGNGFCLYKTKNAQLKKITY